MQDEMKEVQGVALYAEFRKIGATMQVIITPDGYAEDGRKIGATLFRRVVTSYTPKKQWRHSGLRSEVLSGISTLHDDHKERVAEERLSFTTSLFDGLLSGGWVLVKQPILIEASKRDLNDVAAAKTPSKIVYRINQSRVALGFPTEIAS